jgi:hypothetical protein
VLRHSKEGKYNEGADGKKENARDKGGREKKPLKVTHPVLA